MPLQEQKKVKMYKIKQIDCKCKHCGHQLAILSDAPVHIPGKCRVCKEPYEEQANVT